MPVSERQRFDVAALRALPGCARCRGSAAPLQVRAVPRRPVQPDLPAERRRRRSATCCAASRPGRCCPRRTRSTASSASSRALHGSGVPVAQPLLPVRGRGRHRHRCSTSCSYVAGRNFWDPTLPELSAAAARRDLRRDESGAGGSCTRSTMARCGPGRLRQARQLLRAPDRALEQAVPRLARPSASRRWRSCSPGCRPTFRPARRPRSCTATTASTT